MRPSDMQHRIGRILNKILSKADIRETVYYSEQRVHTNKYFKASLLLKQIRVEKI